jgi:hypothetical protein
MPILRGEVMRGSVQSFSNSRNGRCWTEMNCSERFKFPARLIVLRRLSKARILSHFQNFVGERNRDDRISRPYGPNALLAAVW